MFSIILLYDLSGKSVLIVVFMRIFLYHNVVEGKKNKQSYTQTYIHIQAMDIHRYINTIIRPVIN